jgi:16S rRNA (cytosine1402-N4)-methyltransferase
MKHKSVLLEEVIKYLNVSEGKIYIDATVGYAGHSTEILRKLNKKGFLFAVDQDDDAISYSNEALSKISNNFKIFKTNFVHLKDYIHENVDGILFDLGVSSPQLDEIDRGFSFHKDARLDMRMDKDNPLSAYEVVNNYSESELITIFFRYGEERYSKSIARKIIEYRKEKPIETTLELVEIIKTGVPEKYKRETHPAKRVFQAIRIEVNKELEVFEIALKDAIDLLNENGRICVITFHSLEDKIVAKVFKDLCSDDDSVKHLPIVPEDKKARAKKIAKITPSNEELEDNNRSRSSKLRVIERLR